jgi:hypothetical protein
MESQSCRAVVVVVVVVLLFFWPLSMLEGEKGLLVLVLVLVLVVLLLLGDRPQTYAWEMKERRRSKRSSTSEGKDDGSVAATDAVKQASICCRRAALPHSKSFGRSSPRVSRALNKRWGGRRGSGSRTGKNPRAVVTVKISSSSWSGMG